MALQLKDGLDATPKFALYENEKGTWDSLYIPKTIQIKP
jgi:hypothetical protein